MLKLHGRFSMAERLQRCRNKHLFPPQSEIKAEFSGSVIYLSQLNRLSRMLELISITVKTFSMSSYFLRFC